MGKFLQNHLDADQITIDNCPKGFKYKPGFIITTGDLTYISDKGQEIFIKSGYISDGYSIPQLFESIEGGRFELDNRPSTVHDALCQFKGYYDTNGNFFPVTFKQANDMLYECMRAVGIGKFKAFRFRIAVEFNKNRW